MITIGGHRKIKFQILKQIDFKGTFVLNVEDSIALATALSII